MKALDGTAGATLVPAFFDPRIRGLPQRSLFVRSLIPVRQADGDKVRYIRQTVATQNAAPVAAGALKPTSVYTVERVEETVRTIAHVTEALDRALLSDFDSLVDFLDNQLRLGVLLAEESQIINGNGTAPNLRGILNTVGIQTQAVGADPRADAVYKALGKVRGAFFEPDGIVLHPNDWQDIRLTKTADGEYQTAPVTDDGVERLFGKPVITSPVIAEGTGLVGAFAVGATVWDREEARVTFSEVGLNDSGEEMFTRNQLRWRAEERIAFGVERPQRVLHRHRPLAMRRARDCSPLDSGRADPPCGAPRAPSTQSLRRHEDDRHAQDRRAGLVAVVVSSRNPAGWRAEDVARERRRVRCHSRTPLEVRSGSRRPRRSRQCRRGLLEADERGRTLYVRPAIVSASSESPQPRGNPVEIATRDVKTPGHPHYSLTARYSSRLLL